MSGVVTIVIIVVATLIIFGTLIAIWVAVSNHLYLRQNPRAQYAKEVLRADADKRAVRQELRDIARDWERR